MAEPIIVTENLSFTYPPNGEKLALPVFENLSVTVDRGSFTAVIGPNGCGKSTLAKHFNGILLPSGGRVLVSGMDTNDENLLLEIRRTVGMVFQNPDNQIVSNVVEEDVAFAPENLGVPTPEIRSRVDDALKTVGMYEYREHAPHLLSGGQKQRIAIAGVLAMQPTCIVLDEPTAMLDPRGRKEVFETVRELNREGMTVVWITHFMEEAAQCETVHIMHDGGLVLSGTPQEVFSDRERLQNWRLDVPPMAALAQRLRAEGIALPEGILSIDDMTREVEALAAHL